MSPFTKKQKKWIFAGSLFSVVVALICYIFWPRDYQPPTRMETFEYRKRKYSIVGGSRREEDQDE